MFSKIKKLIFSNTAKDTSVLFFGSIVSSGFAIIFTILSARYLGPESFAIAAVAVSFIAIINAIGDLGLGASLFRFVSKHWSDKDEKTANKVLSAIFSLRVYTAFAFLVILTIFSPFLSSLIFKTNQSLLIIFCGIAVSGILLSDFQIQSFQSRRNFGFASFFTAFSNVVRVIFLVVWNYVSPINIVSALFVFAVSPIITFVISYSIRKTKFVSKIEISEIKQYGNFSAWMGANRIVGSLGGRIDTILLLQMLTSYQTGIFAAAKQLSSGVPVIAGSFATVLAPRFASIKGDKLNSYLKKSITLSFIICFGLIIGIIFSPFVVGLFGEKYQESIQVLQLLLAGYIPFVLATPAVNLIIYAFGKPKILTTISIVQLPFVVAGIYLLTPRLGINAPVLMNFLINITTMFYTYFIAFRYLNKEVK